MIKALSSLFGILLLAGAVIRYWWIIALVVAVVWLSRQASIWRREYQDDVADERRAREALIARADTQHRLVIAGDDRGIYGQYPPEKLN